MTHGDDCLIEALQDGEVHCLTLACTWSSYFGFPDGTLAVLNCCAFLILGREREESLTHWKELGCCTRHSEWGEGGGMREWKSPDSHLTESEFQGLTRCLGSQFLSLLLTPTPSSYPTHIYPWSDGLEVTRIRPQIMKAKVLQEHQTLRLIWFPINV